MTVLRVFAGLFVLLAVSNLLKPLEMNESHGFVLFGTRLAGTANMVAGPVFGIYLLVYAIGIFMRRRYAVGMGIAYAAYVIANLAAWSVFKPESAESTLAFSLAYMGIAVGVSSGAAWLLWKDRESLS